MRPANSFLGKCLKQMFIRKRPARARLQISLKIVSFISIRKRATPNQFHRKIRFGCFNISLFMALKSFLQVYSASYIMVAITQFQDVNVVPHWHKIKKARWIFSPGFNTLQVSFATWSADFVRRRSLRRPKAEREGFEPPVPFTAHLISNQAHWTALTSLRLTIIFEAANILSVTKNPAFNFQIHLKNI